MADIFAVLTLIFNNILRTVKHFCKKKYELLGFIVRLLMDKNSACHLLLMHFKYWMSACNCIHDWPQVELYIKDPVGAHLFKWFKCQVD